MDEPEAGKSLEKKVVKGDAEALEAWLALKTPVAFLAAYAVLGCREDAQDAAQQALLNLTLEIRAEKFSKKGIALDAALLTWAHSEAVKLLEKKLRRLEGSKKLAKGLEKREGVMAGQREEQREAWEALREEWAALAPETAAALSLYHLAGQSVQEVAGQLGTTLEACKKRLIRGREELRQRLARRGIGLALGAVEGLLKEFLEDCRQEAGLQVGLVQYQVTPPANPQPEHFAEGRGVQGRPLAIEEKSKVYGQGLKKNLFRSGAVLAALGLMAAIFYMEFGEPGQTRAITDFSSKAAGELGAEAVQGPLAPKGQGEDRKEAGVRRDEPGRDSELPKPQGLAGRQGLFWQPPHFFEGFYPLGMAAAGEYAALLASEDEIPPKVRGLKFTDIYLKDQPIFETRDGGKTWSHRPLVSSPERVHGLHLDLEGTGYCFGGENSHILGVCDTYRKMVLGKGESESSEKAFEEWDKIWEKGQYRCATKFFRFKVGEKLDPGLALWTGAYKEQPEIGCCPAGKGYWFFQREPAPSFRIKASFAPSPSPINLRDTPASGLIFYFYPWALDDKTAGFLIMEGPQKNIFSFWTSDGKTWEKSRLPLSFKETSQGKTDDFGIISLYRDGQKLILALAARFYPPRVFELKENEVKIDFSDCFIQSFLLISQDLGKTWSGPRPVGPQSEGITCNGGRVYAFKDLFFLGHQRSNNNQDRNILMALSQDGGNTWAQPKECLALSKIADSFCMAGSGERIHLAFRIKGPDAKGYLVIRTLAPGQWTVPQIRTPRWFEEEGRPQEF